MSEQNKPVKEQKEKKPFKKPFNKPQEQKVVKAKPIFNTSMRDQLEAALKK